MSHKKWAVAFSLIVAVSLAGCEQKSAEGPVTGASAVVTNAGQSNSGSAGDVPTGGTCGGIAALQCASLKDFCKSAAGRCGVEDGQGACTTKPEICTREYKPVCGCDGKTYGNACEADSNGVSIDADGPCPKRG